MKTVVVYGIGGHLATKRILPGLEAHDVSIHGVSRKLRQASEIPTTRPLTLATTDDPQLPVGPKLIYLAIPVAEYDAVLKSLAGRVTIDDRIVLEKPYGATRAQALMNYDMAVRLVGESQVAAVDHYLAKQTVQNLLELRFGNPLFAQQWNATSVTELQVVLQESTVPDGRKEAFGAGVVTDLVQSHVLGMLALLACEPDHDPVRALKGTRVLETHFGRLPDSDVPTFVAAKLMLPGERWRGVPVHVLAGKGLAQHRVEVQVRFREPNALGVRVQPDEQTVLRVQHHGRVQSLTLSDPCPAANGYPELLSSLLSGNTEGIVSRELIDVQWRIAEQLTVPSSVPTYLPGSFGPEAGLAMTHWCPVDVSCEHGVG